MRSYPFFFFENNHSIMQSLSKNKRPCEKNML